MAMKLISWNVNGLRACVKKGFTGFFDVVSADFFCVQETKLQEDNLKELSFEPDGYSSYWNHAVKKGYSGTVIFARSEPISTTLGIGIPAHDNEGRVITLEYGGFYLVNIYAPNSKPQLERLDYRMIWEDEIRKYLISLDQKKPVMVCGDLNVAHKEIDLKNPSANRGNAGFTDEERAKFSELLDSGFIDTYRHLYPDRKDAYTWWSYIRNARETNAGWRIDYFCISERLAPLITGAHIHSEIYGSDHCPVELSMNL